MTSSTGHILTARRSLSGHCGHGPIFHCATICSERPISDANCVSTLWCDGWRGFRSRNRVPPEVTSLPAIYGERQCGPHTSLQSPFLILYSNSACAFAAPTVSCARYQRCIRRLRLSGRGKTHHLLRRFQPRSGRGVATPLPNKLRKALPPSLRCGAVREAHRRCEADAAHEDRWPMCGHSRERD